MNLAIYLLAAWPPWCDVYFVSSLVLLPSHFSILLSFFGNPARSQADVCNVSFSYLAGCAHTTLHLAGILPYIHANCRQQTIGMNLNIQSWCAAAALRKCQQTLLCFSFFRVFLYLSLGRVFRMLNKIHSSYIIRPYFLLFFFFFKLPRPTPQHRIHKRKNKLHTENDVAALGAIFLSYKKWQIRRSSRDLGSPKMSL
jgi:hypothetical protein